MDLHSTPIRFQTFFVRFGTLLLLQKKYALFRLQECYVLKNVLCMNNESNIF